MIIDWAKALIILLILLKPGSSLANEIYINQVGDNLNMEVVQDGQDNYFQFCSNGTNGTCADVNGNQNNWADGAPSDGSIVNSETIGNDNTVVVSHNTGQNNSNINESNISVTGDRNKVQNFFTNSSSGSNAYSNLAWGGTKESNISITGDDNTVKHASDSYGEVDANISVSGDDNTVTVYQRSLRNTANISVTNAGGPVTAHIQQNGSSYQDTSPNSYSLTQFCTNANGCAVNVTQN